MIFDHSSIDVINKRIVIKVPVVAAFQLIGTLYIIIHACLSSFLYFFPSCSFTFCFLSLRTTNRPHILQCIQNNRDRKRRKYKTETEMGPSFSSLPFPVENFCCRRHHPAPLHSSFDFTSSSSPSLVKSFSHSDFSQMSTPVFNVKLKKKKVFQISTLLGTVLPASLSYLNI